MFNKKIKKVMNVEGMHCDHCASKVENVLKKIPSVSKVKVNLDKKQVEVYLSEEVENSVLTEAIKSVDFEVTNIS